jgi:tRNA A-37 threonylcarbamoyl transferase component Bud32
VDQAGRYQILEELGRGASGVVYRATDPAIGRTVAIKSIRLTNVGDVEEKRLVRYRLLSEARSAGILSHPNIVTIYDVFESGELACISMEFVDGVSLEQLLRAGTLPERPKLLEFLRQIAEALDYAHRKEIVHRDIKPANIIISGRRPDAEQVAKIADFGVATFVSSKVTQNGILAGTPNYMSPEQIQGLTVSGKSDQFSLAVVVYEVLCGAKPFGGENLQALLYSICKQHPKPVEQANPRLNGAVGRAMGRALAKEPDDRFSSCSDFVAALSLALDECPEWRPVAPMGETIPAPIVAAGPPTGRDQRVPPQNAAAAAIAIGTGGELPGRERTARRSEASQLRKEGSAGKRLGLILALCFAVAAACIFIVRLNSGPPAPVQVLDSKAGTSAPPPQDIKPVPKGSRPPPADLTPPPEQSSQPPALDPTVAAAPTTPLPSAPAPKQPEASPEKESEIKPDTAPAKADVELVTDPPGSKVVVDSRQSCLSPCSMPLSNGRHTLTAELTGYTLAQKIIQVPDDTNVFLPLIRSVGVLLVSSEPSGSQVAVDGKNYGPTPLTLHLPAGSHHLTISDGDRRHDETIEIDGDGVHTRTFRW